MEENSPRAKNGTKSAKTKQKKQVNNAVKRTTALNFLALFFLGLYVVLMVLSVVFSWELYKIWFSSVLFFLGCYLLARAIFFHLDSNFLLGLLLVGFAFISAFQFFYNWQLYVFAYFGWTAFSFLAVYFIFRQNIYLILFALSMGEVLLLVVNKLGINVIVFYILQALFVYLVFLVFISVTKIRKEKKSAISNS